MWHYVFAPSRRRITYWITRLRTFMFRFLCCIMFSLLLREELHIVQWLAFNNFKKLPTSLLSKVAISLYIPTSNRKAPVPPQPRLHLLFYYQHLPFCHSHPGGEGVIVILIGSSITMANYGKQSPHVHIGHSNISSGHMSTNIFCSVFNWVGCLFLLSIKSLFLVLSTGLP